MPVRVMVWNVQNFGSVGPAYVNYKGTDSAILAPFIAKVVHQYQIDVLMVLEVMRGAGPSLDNLMYALNDGLANPDWCYDSVRGAVAADSNVTAPEDVVSSDELTWASSAVATRAEGYAVFWRDNQGARFSIKAADRDLSEGSWRDNRYGGDPPEHAITLSLTGRNWITIGPSPGVQSSEAFDPASPGVGWVWSEYPDVTALLTARPRWARARRPAYAAIDLNIGGGRAAKIVPIVVYHAPSRLSLSRMGTYLSGLAEELYVMGGNPRYYHPKAIAGGDYNVDTRMLDPDHPGDWTVAYKKYFMPFSTGLPPTDDWDAGADMDAFNTDNRGRATIIKLRHNVNGVPVGPPILNQNLGFYYSRPIDNVFYRGVTNPNTYVLLLPNTVMQGGALTGAPMQRWFNGLVQVALAAQQIDAQLGPQNPTGAFGALEPVFPNMTDWNRFLTGIQQGFFLGDPDTGAGDARSAAVFVHDFVSDHLPLYVEFDVA
jgi:hypothetical protein